MQVLGHGIDLVPVERIESMLLDHGTRFLDRCFTVREQAYCETGGPRRVERYAVRFAAKEAVVKALGTGLRNGMLLTQIEVVHDDAGKPGIVLSGSAAVVAGEAGVQNWILSLTHVDTLASASVLAMGE